MYQVGSSAIMLSHTWHSSDHKAKCRSTDVRECEDKDSKLSKYLGSGTRYNL